ncbi:MAG TPA: VCBS repeat-containing protein, partial [Planctomycetaceae bacterium]
GDGLKDIVTGKTYYSHHKGSPMWDAGAVVYWFRLTRTDKGVEWVPYQADSEAGIGRQVSVVDINGDKLPDIVVGGMLGAHVLTHRKKSVGEAEWREAQPKPRPDQAADKSARGPRPTITDNGRVAGALEGEELKVLKASTGQTALQTMDGFTKDRWSGKKQLFWTGGKPGERLDLEFQVADVEMFDVLAAFTMARDYGIINVEIDGQPLRKEIDLYNSPDVISTGELTLGKLKLDAGPHKLTLAITGANPAAVPAYMVGLDYLRLQPNGAKK